MPSKQSFLITRCEDIPLSVFIEIMCDGDHSRLGEGDTEKAWDTIREQYDQLVGGLSYGKTVILIRDINYLSTKISFVGMVVDLMHKYYLPQFGQVLSFYGFRYKWEGISDQQYQSQLDKVISMTKTWYVQLKAKSKEWEEIESKTSDEPITRDYFEEWLIGLSKSQGYHIKATDITAYQFALLIRNHMKEVKKATATAKRR